MKMSLAAVVLLALAAPGPDARFDADGLRIGEALVKGAALDLRETPGGLLLASGEAVEPLSSTLSLALAADRTLLVEPGVRASRAPEGVVLTTHAGRPLQVGERVVEGPVAVKATAAGWNVAGTDVEGRELHARLAQQDPDRNLESMREAARRIEQSRGRPPQQQRRGRLTNAFRENPLPTAEATDSQTLRFLQSVSLN